MKKKNLKKLLKNFRPSMEQTKNRLFRELENKALNQYQMPIKVYTYKNRKNELFIEFLGQTTKDKLLTVPLDKTFDTIIKRIQNEEPGLFEQFSSNLVEEIVTYWYQAPKRSNTENQQKPVEEPEQQEPETAYWCIEGGTHHIAGDGANEHGYYSSWDSAYQAFEEYTKDWASCQYKIDQCACGKYYFWAIK